MRRIAHETPPVAELAVALLRTDADGRVAYKAGFGWEGDGRNSSKEAWLESLEQAGATAAPAS
jgi:hypothetical protein